MNESNQTLVRLALAVADALECPERPESLRDPLNELASSLINVLGVGNVAHELRALADTGSGGCYGMGGSRKRRL